MEYDKIVPAIIQVMSAVKNIEKNMTVGAGQNSYKGVSDKDVKLKLSEEMSKAGLVIVPTSINPQTQIHNYVDSYQKAKQVVFTEVTPKYLLIHTSGQFIELEGYGQGVDSQDKAAGKATTYALKNTLLYTFLIPTGSIDDADKTHSDDLPTAPAQQQKPQQAQQELPWLNLVRKDGSIDNAVATRLKEFFSAGGDMDGLKLTVKISTKDKEAITNQILNS